MRAIGARPLLLTTQASSEDAAVSFHLLQAFPMATVVEKGSELYSKISDQTGEAWKQADGLVSLPGAAPTAQQLVAATRFATSCIAMLVKDESVSSMFPLFNQTPMRRVCVGTGTGFSLLIASKRVVYSMDPTAFVQLTPMDAQLWALSPEEWRASFAMRMQHALLPSYPPFAATPNGVPFLAHPSTQFMPTPVPQPHMFFPGPAPLNPLLGMAAGQAAAAGPSSFHSSHQTPSGHLSLPPISSQMPFPQPGRLPTDSLAIAALDNIHLSNPNRNPMPFPLPSSRIASVSSLLALPDHIDPSSKPTIDDSFGLDGLAAGALASIVKRGSQDESDSDNAGSGGDNESDPDNHNSLLFLKGAHAANQGRNLEGAIRKFKNQYSKKDVITRVCKMKYRSAQRKLRIAKYIEIWPEIATMSQRAAERYISQNLKKRTDLATAIGDD